MKVLDLFAGTQSVRKALVGMDIDFEYKGIDIYSPEEENIICSLAEEDSLEQLLKVLDGWKPDVIWASPVCNATSQALTVKGGGTTYFKLVNGELVVRRGNDDFKDITHHWFRNKILDPEWQAKQTEFAEMTLRMFDNTKKIINHFGVPFAIENPKGAYSKQLLGGYVRNWADYCMYGFDYKKSTYIYSDQLLFLQRCNHSTHSVSIHPSRAYDNVKSYADRAAVPPKLIREVIESICPKKNQI